MQSSVRQPRLRRLRGWEILQARYALCVLFEYAATLGLIDVAYVPPADAREDFRRLWAPATLVSEPLRRFELRSPNAAGRVLPRTLR